MNTLKLLAAAAAMLTLAGTAQAGLVSLGNGTVKDENTNLIWLQDWNVNAQGNWVWQKTWAETGLDGFAGSDDWRLPSIDEFVALFSAYGDLSGVTEFANVQLGQYWSGTQSVDGSNAWIFAATDGSSQLFGIEGSFRAVAVRFDDSVATVAEPQTLVLALLALGATVVARRERSS